VGEDEVTIKINGLLVVLCGLGELPEDEVELGTVIVDIWIFAVVLNR
jgi:hypothetical protein